MAAIKWIAMWFHLDGTGSVLRVVEENSNSWTQIKKSEVQALIRAALKGWPDLLDEWLPTKQPERKRDDKGRYIKSAKETK